jgi:hypothetical protein
MHKPEMYKSATLALFFRAAGLSHAADTHLLAQKPTLNKTHIVFSFAGDLWSVPRDGEAPYA